MCALIVRTLLQAPVFQLVIGSLTCRENFVLRQCDIICDMIIVCAIVGDVQFAITVHEGQVTITVQATRMTCTNRYQVTIIDVINRCGCVTKQCCSIGKHLVVTRRNVTTGKDGIVDDDTVHIQTAPCCSVSGLVLQGVQVGCGDILTCLIGVAIDSDIRQHLTMWLYQYLAVLGHVFLTTSDRSAIIIGINTIL